MTATDSQTAGGSLTKEAMILNRKIAGLFVLMCAILQTIVVPPLLAKTQEMTAVVAEANADPVDFSGREASELDGSEPDGPELDGSELDGSPLERSEVERLLDRVIAAQLAAEGIAGAAVAVVADGRVVAVKGYGMANFDAGAAVDPERTLFRVGSISKLFVWTAVMQLVEQGRLDLDADVNRYLDFEIPNRLHGRAAKGGAGPITLKHLMSHSAGFEDVPADLFHLHQEQALPLGQYIRTHIPARVFPPGEVSSYSNYGSALAGYIVERVSGMPFEKYVEQFIFSPLQMTRSTFRQPVDPGLAEDVASGYRWADGQFIEGDFVYALGPAGGMSGTAADMARFMLAHLQGGMLDGRRILSDESARRMHAPLFAQHPAVDGMAHGFLEQTYNGRRVLSHMGSVLIFNSGLYLLPEANVGLFVSYNGGSHLQPMGLFRKFMNEFFTGADAVASGADGEGSRAGVSGAQDEVAASALSISGTQDEVASSSVSGTRGEPGDFSSPVDNGARDYVGEYHINRRSFTTDAGILAFLETLRVDVDSDGDMLVTHLGQSEKFLQVGPGTFRNAGPEESLDPYGAFATIVFKAGSDGNTFLLSDGPMSYTKAPWYMTSGFTLAAIGIGVLVPVGTALGWGIHGVVRRLRRRGNRGHGIRHGVQRRGVSRQGLQGRGGPGQGVHQRGLRQRNDGGIDAGTVARAAVVGFALVTAIFLLGALSVSGDMEPAYGVPKSYFGIEPEWASFLDLLPIPMVALGAVMIVSSVIAWRGRTWGLGGRIHYTFVTVCAVVLLTLLRGWHVF